MKPEPAQKPAPASRKRMFGSLLVLVAIAGVTALIIGQVEKNTHTQVIANQAARALSSISAVLPADGYDNIPHLDILYIRQDSHNSQELPAYRARLGNTPVAAVLTVDAPGGYVAPIRLLIGISSAGSIIAVRALQHLETPGLGDQIDADKSDWITRFAGHNSDAIRTALTLKRDGGELDHISGATITSRAVARTVATTLLYYEQHRDTLFAAPAAVTETDALKED